MCLNFSFFSLNLFLINGYDGSGGGNDVGEESFVRRKETEKYWQLLISILSTWIIRSIAIVLEKLIISLHYFIKSCKWLEIF